MSKFKQEIGSKPRKLSAKWKMDNSVSVYGLDLEKEISEALADELRKEEDRRFNIAIENIDNKTEEEWERQLVLKKLALKPDEFEIYKHTVNDIRATMDKLKKDKE